MLRTVAAGFGGFALNGTLGLEALAGRRQSRNSLAPRDPHFPARAKRVIFLFMQGGPSHVDTFDFKPALEKYDGKPPPFERARVQFAKRGNLMKSPWEFGK